MRHWIIFIAFILAGLVWSEPPAVGDTASTQPASTQGSFDATADSLMRTWLAQLADPDPKVRDQALTDLMGLSRDDLPRLRQLVIENQPLSLPQVTALHDIVTQVYLATDTYAAAAAGQLDATGVVAPYFLGISWQGTSDDERIAFRFGAPVGERLPGFPAFRFLRPGDMILSVSVHPDNPRILDIDTHSITSLQDAIKTAPTSQQVTLTVLRNGETLKMNVKLAPRPAVALALDREPMDEFSADRLKRAQTYWGENFQPVLDKGIQTSNPIE